MKWAEVLDREGSLRWQRAKQLEEGAQELRALAVAYWERAAEVRRMEEDVDVPHG